MNANSFRASKSCYFTFLAKHVIREDTDFYLRKAKRIFTSRMQLTIANKALKIYYEKTENAAACA